MAKATFNQADVAITSSGIAVKEMIKCLRAAFPPIFARRDIPKYLGSSLPVGTIANMGKEGPPYIRQGRHAVYEKGAFLAWYENWLLNASNN